MRNKKNIQRPGTEEKNEHNRMLNYVKEESDGKSSSFLMDNSKILSKKIMENLTKVTIIMAETRKKWMKLTRNTQRTEVQTIE